MKISISTRDLSLTIQALKTYRLTRNDVCRLVETMGEEGAYGCVEPKFTKLGMRVFLERGWKSCKALGVESERDTKALKNGQGNSSL